MRIISGKHKGRRITAPKKLPVRPTTDLAKESLFNILNNNYYLETISIIDLFSGTGNIAFEFASRGTKKIYAVDLDFNCIKFINKTSAEFDFPIKSFRSDVFNRNLLHENGLLIVEHSKHMDLSENKHLSYSKKYGGSVFSFYKAKKTKVD